VQGFKHRREERMVRVGRGKGRKRPLLLAWAEMMRQQHLLDMHALGSALLTECCDDILFW
jgi:hypothetical protein